MVSVRAKPQARWRAWVAQAGALHEPHAGLGHASHALGRCLPGARGTTRISSSSSVSERCCPTSREHYSPPGLRRRCGSSSWCILVQNARREASFCCLLSDSEWNELLTGQPELPNEECFGLALRVDNGTAPLLLTHHPVQEPGLGEARSKCIFPLFQQDHMVRTSARTAYLCLHDSRGAAWRRVLLPPLWSSRTPWRTSASCCSSGCPSSRRQ
ncbi:unnamed protein product [Effrenium voratum]|uniref:Uncharacterized protein n=1 Tax=Effrenium voratum TaxID=2562239 RepID=A0AA36I6N2_9DINO|nr:unnamed protein product [Effrenium voratum]